MSLDPIVVNKLHIWLGKEGRHFFRTLAKLYKGDVTPVLRLNGFIPVYPVHFRDGMSIRNFLRDLEECKNWTHDQFEDDYPEYIKAAMKEKL